MEAPGAISSDLPVSNENYVFPTPFAGAGQDQPRTIVELRLLALRAAIMRKKQWPLKLNDPQVVGRWRAEAIDQGSDGVSVDYVLNELRYLATRREGLLEPAPVDGVWQADGLISDAITAQLVAGVASLENVPEDQLDWHPGSNGQVLDLVHPSLFCFVAGISRQTKEPLPWEQFLGTGEVLPAPRPRRRSRDEFHSRKFQWLPAEFCVRPDGRVGIESYINNLHPQMHSRLYTTIGAIFERFLPLFEKVLTGVLNPSPLRVEPPNVWRPYRLEEIEDPTADDDDQMLKQPKVPSFSTPPGPTREVNLRGRRLQVIVKLANIILTPEKPEYPGGAWHVEGMANECIVATGIYYYDQENITESRLAFRQAVTVDIIEFYQQDDDIGVKTIFGIDRDGPQNQDAGYIVAEKGRCVAFPNMMQHRVQPFMLQDATKPGFRKILVFFLVDPCHRVLSTATVPPQQHTWLEKELSDGMQASLPEEVIDMISKKLPWPMGLEEAKRHREELMKERTQVRVLVNNQVFEVPFELCEH